MSTKDEVFGCSPMPRAVCQERVARGDNLPLKFTHRSDAKLVSQLQEEVTPTACQATQRTYSTFLGPGTSLRIWRLPCQVL